MTDITANILIETVQDLRAKLAAAERDLAVAMAERDELRKDKERLDKAERLLRLNTWPPFSTPGAPFKYFVFGPVISGCTYPRHESLRAAIDAAMEAKRG